MGQAPGSIFLNLGLRASSSSSGNDSGQKAQAFASSAFGPQGRFEGAGAPGRVAHVLLKDADHLLFEVPGGVDAKAALELGLDPFEQGLVVHDGREAEASGQLSIMHPLKVGAVEVEGDAREFFLLFFLLFFLRIVVHEVS